MRSNLTASIASSRRGSLPRQRNHGLDLVRTTVPSSQHLSHDFGELASADILFPRPLLQLAKGVLGSLMPFLGISSRELHAR